MERRDGSIAKRVETYSGADLNPLGATVSVNVMDSEAAPAFVVDQGLYCPAPTGYYGYYCTGYQTAGDWDNHTRVLQLDNQDLHYSALQAESLPYVYYPPNYGYAQSAYNPFNPYIPGAIIGVDGQFVGSQPYYSSTSYQHAISSSTYSPIVFQSSSDIPTCSLPTNSLLSIPVSSSSGLDGAGGTYATPASATPVIIADGPLEPKREGGNQSTSIQNVQPIDTRSVPPVASKGATCAVPSSSMSKVNGSDGHFLHSSEAGRERQHQPVSIRKLQPAYVKPGTSEGAMRQLASPEMFSSTSISQNSLSPATIQVKDYIPLRRLTPVQRPLDITVATAVNEVVDVGSGHHGWSMNNKSNRPLHFGMAVINMDRSPDALSEQNRGPRTSRTKNQWTSPLSLRVYSTRAFSNDVKEDNILIYADHYNRDDFPVSYPDAKFFVIKSYSEDDVHKSIKYNVWSSTPNGNKRLDAAYADAQRKSGGKHRACPIFLFFSVNASGQFCGVAEMIGSVDFQKDMDFWQQDKWNGSFPVKWHLIKDVPNPHFRHIILENNENKPVTNSRDTQEVKYTQGIEMLKIFKGYSSKTSILDDFMYYEERQQALFDKKAKYYNQRYKDLDTTMTNGRLVGTIGLQTSHVLPQTANDAKEYTKTVPVQDVDNMLSNVKISSLASEPEKNNSSVSSDIVTVGSMPIKVNGHKSVLSSSADKAKESDDNLSILTVGTISIDPKALKLGKHGSFAAGNRSTCRI